MTEQPLPIAFYTPNLSGGGAERTMLVLAGAMLERGYRVDFLVDHKVGALVDQIPDGINIRVLSKTSALRGATSLLLHTRGNRTVIVRGLLTSAKLWQKLANLQALAEYLRTQSPRAVICALGITPLLAHWAGDIAGQSTPIIARQDNNLSAKLADAQIPGRQRRKRERVRRLMAGIYPRLDAIVAVSDGVRDDLANQLGMAAESITTIYNPVISHAVEKQALETVDHPWLQEKQPPVVLAVGRLNTQKGFDDLLTAFASVRRHAAARLIILGEGSKRADLEAQIYEMGIASHVDLAGWVTNPYAYMARAAVFVLPSIYEGFGNVLVEAMGCGCPVVATDCPSGPREILCDGQLGQLVPVGEPEILANAIVETLRNPPDTRILSARAQDFSVENSVAGYEALIDRFD